MTAMDAPLRTPSYKMKASINSTLFANNTLRSPLTWGALEGSENQPVQYGAQSTHLVVVNHGQVPRLVNEHVLRVAIAL